MKRRRSSRRSNKQGAPKWMVTYSDMVTLILVFFILLFSMSQIDSTKFNAVSESFKGREIFDFAPATVPIETPLNPDSGNIDSPLEQGKGKDISVPDDIDQDKINQAIHKEDALNKLMTDVDKYLNENDLNDVVSATRTDRGVELILQESILFNSGDAEILKKGEPFLNKIGDLLAKVPNYIRVEGHTDNRPISNYRYPSNWELSSSRAGSVIRYLIDERGLDTYRFSSVGYGDTRPIVPNTSKENWGKNRRVEIVILEEGNDPNKQS